MLNYSDFSSNLSRVLLECSLFMSFGTTPYTFSQVQGTEVENKYVFQEDVVAYFPVYLWKEYGVVELEDFLRNSQEVISMDRESTERYIEYSLDRYLDDDLLDTWKIKQGTIAFGYLVAKLKTAQELRVSTANPIELELLEDVLPGYDEMKLFAVAILH